jgi:hypothetical protein
VVEVVTVTGPFDDDELTGESKLGRLEARKANVRI